MAEDGKPWDPWVVKGNGKDFEVFTVVWDQLCGRDDASASLVGAVLGTARADVLDDWVDPQRE